MQVRTKLADDSIELRVPAGHVVANLDGGLLHATGIPYASAVRWQRPVALPARRIVAKTKARACPQLPVPRLDAALPDAFQGLQFDENCLDLSITAPVGADKLPVIVWLHGGSYESGAADMAIFNPDALVAEQNVVFVSVSYRLGLFGWLSGDGRPANLGGLDVIAALRWLAKNIAGFGGDPGNVTLLGQSSGGDLAARLLLAPDAQGLFHRAIIQSAPLALPLAAQRLQNAMRKAAGDLTHDMSVATLLEHQQRVRKAVRLRGLAGQMPFGPEFGAEPFPAVHELRDTQVAAAQRIPIMIGHVQDEAALFVPPSHSFVGRLADAARRLLVASLTSRLYGAPGREFAWRHIAAGGQAQRFVIEWEGGAFGKAHLLDLPLLFPGPEWVGTPLLPANMSLDELTEAGRPLRALWAGFARDGQAGKDVPGIVRFAPQG
ncbi:carboxylesterase family protein [Paracoccus albus]|uniref:carboxylesterase family protein n=1 Tax=Paracoccus albus TaxID=3017784 RepID=UPI0022F08315|nr:carboxylesterase family protein [Paracoccus albus]WBU61144.1 carboxylesterase family protein [Paracoccus albus]